MATTAPIPSVPWQLTGNHWLSIPCIHPGDGGIHAVGVVHRGSRAAVEFAGSSDFLTGRGPALARPVIEIDGVRFGLDSTVLAWERAYAWLPTFTCTIESIVIRATVFAPYGRDADTAGAVYAFAFESRRDDDCRVTISLEGVLGHRQLRVRTAHAFEDAHVAVAGDGNTIVLRGSALPGIAALAIGSDGEAVRELPNGQGGAYAIRRAVRVPAQGQADAAFFLAVGPEGDGAVGTAGVMRRRGWRALLSATRDALRVLEQSTGQESIDGLLNRNLL